MTDGGPFAVQTPKPSLSDDNEAFRDIGGAGDADLRLRVGTAYGGKTGGSGREGVIEAGVEGVMGVVAGAESLEVDADRWDGVSAGFVVASAVASFSDFALAASSS